MEIYGIKSKIHTGLQLGEDIKTHLSFLNFQKVVSKELKECE